MTLDIRGTWTAIVTPMTAGEPEPQVDFDALCDLVDAQIAGGVEAIVPCGTTGESPTLSHAEHDAVVKRVVEHAAGRVPVIAGAGSNSTREALRLMRHAAESGADGALVVCPYYNRPNQRMLLEHFGTLAELVDLPVVLYNIPSRTGINLEPETVAELARRHAGIVGIKEAAGSVDQMARIRELSDIGILSGDDGLTLAMMRRGATGVVSVASNVVPELVSRCVRAELSGDSATADQLGERLSALYSALFVEPNPVPVKCALRLLGRGSGLVRGPLLPPVAATEETLRAVLRELELLP